VINVPLVNSRVFEDEPAVLCVLLVPLPLLWASSSVRNAVLAHSPILQEHLSVLGVTLASLLRPLVPRDVQHVVLGNSHRRRVNPSV